MSIIRGRYPTRAWNQAFRDGYDRAFGGRLRARLVQLGNLIESWFYGFEPAWNAGLCRAVRDRVDVLVLAEGGIRRRGQIDGLLGSDCDMVGMARPFCAEPRLPARLLGDGDAPDPATAAICDSCNNCTVPRVTGEPGICRTPRVLERVGELRRQGAHDRKKRD